MEWVLYSLCNAILGALQQSFVIFGSAFVANFGINIGSHFPSLGNEGISLANVYANMGKASSLFDMIFPIPAFKAVIVGLAVTLAIFITVFSLYKTVLWDDNEGSPIGIAGRFATSLFGIVFSYQIFLTIEYLFNSIYIQFNKIGFSDKVIKGVTASGSSGFLTNYQATQNAITKSVDTLFSAEGLSKLDLMQAQKTSGAGAVDVSGGGTGTTLLVTLICLFAIIAILIEFFKLLFELVERYVTLGLLFYSSPIAFSTLSSKSTSNIFSNWLKMVISQCLLVIFGSFFLTTFFGAMVSFSNNIDKLKDSSGLGGSTAITYLIFMLMLVAWLVTGQKIDQHLKALGLSTAQAGGGLRAAVFGSVGAAMAIGKAGKRLASGVAKAPEKAAEKAAGLQNKIDTMKTKPSSSKMSPTGNKAMDQMFKGKETSINPLSNPDFRKSFPTMAEQADALHNSKGIEDPKVTIGNSMATLTDKEGRGISKISDQPNIRGNKGTPIGNGMYGYVAGTGSVANVARVSNGIAAANEFLKESGSGTPKPIYNGNNEKIGASYSETSDGIRTRMAVHQSSGVYSRGNIESYSPVIKHNDGMMESVFIKTGVTDDGVPFVNTENGLGSYSSGGEEMRNVSFMDGSGSFSTRCDDGMSLNESIAESGFGVGIPATCSSEFVNDGSVTEGVIFPATSLDLPISDNKDVPFGVACTVNDVPCRFVYGDALNGINEESFATYSSNVDRFNTFYKEADPPTIDEFNEPVDAYVAIASEGKSSY